MANSIRKGNYATNGSVSGKVTAVKGDELTLDTGDTILKANATRLSAADYKAVIAGESTAPSVKKPARKKATKSATKSVGVRDQGKKAAALNIFNGNPGISRKDFTAQMAKHGLSAAGSSTYFYNIKNGKWAA